MADIRSTAGTRVYLAAAATLLLAALSPASSPAAWSGQEGPVVYVGVTPGEKPSLAKSAGLRRFAFGVAGSRAQLTTDPSDRDPQVSPDGRLIVFSRVTGSYFGRSLSAIFVAGIDGSAPRRLTDAGPEGSDVQPAFSASGERVIFVRISGELGPRRDLYSVGVDGSDLTPLTSGPADDRMPVASPTGRQIVFVRTRYRPDDTELQSPHIYSMRPDGSRLRDLTPRLRSEKEPWDPDISSSGRIIAFATNGNNLRGDIFTLRASGGPVRRLTNRPRRANPTFPRPYGYTNPAFSPAGDSLIAVARSGSSPRLARIRLADPDRPRILAPSLGGSAPVWAPVPGSR